MAFFENSKRLFQPLSALNSERKEVIMTYTDKEKPPIGPRFKAHERVKRRNCANRCTAKHIKAVSLHLLHSYAS